MDRIIAETRIFVMYSFQINPGGNGSSWSLDQKAFFSSNEEITTIVDFIAIFQYREVRKGNFIDRFHFVFLRFKGKR